MEICLLGFDIWPWVLLFTPRWEALAPLKKLEDENAILNIQNQDENFFLWSGLAAIHPVNRTNMSNQKQELNVSETEFPMKLKDKPKFEKKNRDVEH